VRVVRIGHRVVGVEVVRGDDLDDLALLGGGECSLQVLRSREMPDPPLVLRERLVGNVPDEILEEAVLAMLRRPWIGLDPEYFLADQPGEERLEVVLRAAGVNVFPSTAPSWRSRRSSAVRPSSRAAISACSVSGTSREPISPTGVYTGPSRTSRPRSSSIRTVSTA
jgi:hypothetical protein